MHNYRSFRKGRLRKIMLISLVILAVMTAGIYFYLQHPKFGALPTGERLAQIESSPHYVNGQFQNSLPTVQLAEKNFFTLLWELLFAEKERAIPEDPIPALKTDLTALDKEQDTIIWLGHSSYFLQLEGKRILLDPVFSPYASPVFFANKAFPGTNPYTAEDMPEIDYLLISHDHWDHLDYPTIMALKSKIKNIVCGLGVGAHFEKWGFADQLIYEADWFTALELEDDFVIHVLPARHFSGRLPTRNKSLWVSYGLVTPQRRIFFSGDSGYGPHFQEIGQLLQGVDLAIMENGQYDKNWPSMHMMPEEMAQATEELQARNLLPAHAGKFVLANHPWDEPFKRITAASEDKSYRLLTPMLGEPVELGNEQQVFSPWWEEIK